MKTNNTIIKDIDIKTEAAFAKYLKEIKEIKEMLKNRQSMLKIYDNKFYKYIRNNIRKIETLSEEELLNFIDIKYNILRPQDYNINDIACEIIEDI